MVLGGLAVYCTSAWYWFHAGYKAGCRHTQDRWRQSLMSNRAPPPVPVCPCHCIPADLCRDLQATVSRAGLPRGGSPDRLW